MKYFYYVLGLLLALAPTILFATTMKHWPEPWEDHTAFARTLMSVGQNDAGIAEFKEAVRLHPGDVQHVNLGTAQALLGNLTEASGEYRAALAVNPQSVDANSYLGLILVMQGRTKEGIAQFQEALRLDPQDEQTHWRLGSVWLRMGMKEQALDQFSQVVRDEPTNAQAYFNLANALMQLGRATEAIDQYQAALKLAPGNEDVLKSISNAQAAIQSGAAK